VCVWWGKGGGGEKPFLLLYKWKQLKNKTPLFDLRSFKSRLGLI